MNMRDRETPGLTAFRQRIDDWAYSRLADTNPAYVQAAQIRLIETGGDIERVRDETASLLNRPPGYDRLLTCLLDVELWMDKCRQAVWYLGSTPTSDSLAYDHAGLWLEYHIDAWYLFAYGLLDRLRKLIVSTCRQIIRAKDAARSRIIQTELTAEVEALKRVISDARNAVAHGGGSVEALIESGLWEPYLVAGEFARPADTTIHIIGADYGTRAGRQQMWHQATLGYTARILTASGTWFQRLTEEAFAD